ncbi:hypothetical protein DFH06DRAFT_1149919 [Mycena polygramma]|nr:hypothetical protein DFH06DRAFT_1149919 [Mycena polygramma]
MTPRVAEHSEDLGAAESAGSAGLIGIGGGIVGDGESGCTDITVSPLYVPCPQGTGTEGQRTIRTDRTCGSWKAGKCREPGGNPEGEGVSEDERDTEVKPEKDRRDRRMTMEEEEDVEKRRMMTEATGGGRSIGSGETRKVNRDNRKRRKSRGRSKIDTEAHGGARGRNVPERPKSRSSREGRKRQSAWPCGRKLAEKSFFGPELGPEPKTGSRSNVGWGIGKESGKQKAGRRFRSGKRRMGRPEYWPRGMKIDLKQFKVMEEVPESSAEAEGYRGRKGKWQVYISQPRKVEALHNQTIRRKSTMGEGKEVKMEASHIVGFGLRDSIKAERDSAEGQDRRWRTRIGEWNEKSRSLMDQCSISEARRFGVGVVATSGPWSRCPQTPQSQRRKCKQTAAWPKDLGQEQWTRNSETGGRENECKVVQSRLGSRLGRDPRRCRIVKRKVKG